MAVSHLTKDWLNGFSASWESSIFNIVQSLILNSIKIGNQPLTRAMEAMSLESTTKMSLVSDAI